MSPHPLAERWWSRRFIDVLESYGLGARMERGRRYARGGKVLSLAVGAGKLEARVQGSRRTPYRVTLRAAVPTAAQWRSIEAVFATRLGWAARLLAAEVPADLEEGFQQAGVALFPQRWDDLEARCGCPDQEVPCKHIAAALYVFAQRLDDDPWLLLAWRGRQREVLLERLRRTVGVGGATRSSAAVTGCSEEPLPPWWPRGLQAGSGPRVHLPEPLPPDPPERVLERLGPLILPDAPAGLQERLVALYETMVLAGGPDAAGDGEGAPGER
jgi:uncharacterized Zn finger protein